MVWMSKRCFFPVFLHVLGMFSVFVGSSFLGRLGLQCFKIFLEYHRECSCSGPLSVTFAGLGDFLASFFGPQVTILALRPTTFRPFAPPNAPPAAEELRRFLGPRALVSFVRQPGGFELQGAGAFVCCWGWVVWGGETNY